MRMSVLVPTYRRPIDLSRCLAALRAQNRPPDQVLVVRRDDDAETESLLAELSATLPLTVCIVSAPGVVAALNAGLARFDGDVIAITDDDAAPRTDWLAKIQAYFESDPGIGGVGGRDYIARALQPEQLNVGVFQWFGRAIHNHHLGVGKPRYVDFLKGVNMSYRASAIEGVRFDERLLGSGAQVHNELMFSLEVGRKGWKLLYDPAVAVDHYPAERHDSDARGGPSLDAVYNSAFNETLTYLEHFSPRKRALFWAFSFAFGTQDLPGVGQVLRLIRGRPGIWRRLPYVVRGRLAARSVARRSSVSGLSAAKRS